MLPIALGTAHSVTLQMVAKQLRTVFNQTLPRLRAVLAGGATSQIRVVLEVWVVASNYDDEGRSPAGRAES